MISHGSASDEQADQIHRQGYPTQGITFDSLFSEYEFRRQDSVSMWPDDTLVGAELEAWRPLTSPEML